MAIATIDHSIKGRKVATILQYTLPGYPIHTLPVFHGFNEWCTNLVGFRNSPLVNPRRRISVLRTWGACMHVASCGLLVASLRRSSRSFVLGGWYEHDLSLHTSFSKRFETLWSTTSCGVEWFVLYTSYLFLGSYNIVFGLSFTRSKPSQWKYAPCLRLPAKVNESMMLIVMDWNIVHPMAFYAE